ncbi:MAG: radical SAM protein [Acidobacteriota bacterium]
MSASYVEAYRNGRLAEAARLARERLAECTLCPRLCRVDRLSGETGYCRMGRHAVVASYGPHFGEEKPLVGRRGSGTIFFSYCNLFCLFCQNEDISHGGEGTEITAETLAAVMLDLQAQGCHNINFVTPSHVIAQILEALLIAVEGGLTVPLVYNCGGYERVSSLRLLEGIVDIYMPDFKFWDPEAASRLCGASDYPERARRALVEMHRQVGLLETDRSGVARRGLLVRHLVMPGRLAGTESVARFIAGEISPDTYVNIMSQYHPCGEAVGKPLIGRAISTDEFEEALRAARKSGLRRLDERYKHWISLDL